jgi:glycosyltransferase involved in cell wall biosynthesis
MGPHIANSTPRVSVIMPSYNTAAFIAASLDSVFRQTLPDFEVIVVNDGSPDTAELEAALAPYLSRISYIKQENKRAAGARNTAIRQSRGEFLAFLDSDDLWFPKHLTAQMQLFEANPELDLVYCNCFSLGDSTQTEKFMDRCPSNGPANFATLVVERCQIPISTVVARKASLIKAGLFDERLVRCDDYDMWLRAAFYGAKIAYTREVQARLNERRPGSLGVTNVKMIEAYWQILEKALRTLPLSGPDRNSVQARANQIHGMYLYELAKVQFQEGQLEAARKLLADANSYLHSPKLSVAAWGLATAPRVTRQLFAIAARMCGRW